MESSDPQLDLQALVEAPVPNERRIWHVQIPAGMVPPDERAVADAMLLLTARDLSISGFSVEWRLEVSSRHATLIAHQSVRWGLSPRDGKVHGTASAGREIMLVAKSHDSLHDLANTCGHEMRHLWQQRLGIGGDREADARQYAEDACDRFWPTVLEWTEEARLMEAGLVTPQVQHDVLRRRIDLVGLMIGE